jgi:uncharacterized FAD-dependent dehydrogenase
VIAAVAAIRVSRKLGVGCGVSRGIARAAASGATAAHHRQREK